MRVLVMAGGRGVLIRDTKPEPKNKDNLVTKRAELI